MAEGGCALQTPAPHPPLRVSLSDGERRWFDRLTLTMVAPSPGGYRRPMISPSAVTSMSRALGRLGRPGSVSMGPASA